MMRAPFVICLLRLQVGILTGGIEAGAVLGHVGKFAMPHDANLWVIPSKRLQQLIECLLLGRRSGVIIVALGVDTAFIADADGTAVVIPGMNTTHILG